MKRRGIEGLLERLDLDHRAVLFHAMACSTCSAEAVMEMAVRDGGKLFLRRPAKPSAISPPEALEPAFWVQRLAQAEPTDLDLFRRALGASKEIQATDAGRSGTIALEVLEHRDRLLSVPGGLDVVMDALTLTINATRLLGGYHEHEHLGKFDARDPAGFAEVSAPAQGRYRRARGLMLWEQGDWAGAIEQLELAQIAFGSSEIAGEEGATLALLGLALLESEGEATDARFMLMAGLSGMNRGERPWLETRALHALAVSCCRGGRPDLGRGYLIYSGKLEGSSERRSDLLWGEGNVLATLNDTARAVPLLREARDLIVEQRSFGEAVLVTLDLSYALATEGEVGMARARREIERLGEWFAGEPAIEIARLLDGWWGRGESGLVQRWFDLKRTLLIALRGEDGPGLTPLPFV